LPCPPSVDRSHPIDPVPPSWFRTTSTASSAAGSRACCVPVPDEVHRVSGLLIPAIPATLADDPNRVGLGRPSPRRTSHPSKNPPHAGHTETVWHRRGPATPAAAPRHRGRCPPAVSTASRLCSAWSPAPLRPPLPASPTGRVLPGLCSPSRSARHAGPSRDVLVQRVMTTVSGASRPPPQARSAPKRLASLPNPGSSSAPPRGSHGEWHEGLAVCPAAAFAADSLAPGAHSSRSQRRDERRSTADLLGVFDVKDRFDPKGPRRTPRRRSAEPRA